VTYSGLEPATAEQFAGELTACLALVVPVGMTEEARREWLAVAWGTLKHLPADLLSAGCKEARKSADHPSKIVPAITAYAESRLEQRRRIRREFSDAPRLAAPTPDYCTPEEAAEILASLGMKSLSRRRA
jgi:hypothetical protein